MNPDDGGSNDYPALVGSDRRQHWEKARLHRILYQYGLRNGTASSCPTTRAWSTARGTSSPNPASSDPRYIVKLALEGGFNGIALQIGLAGSLLGLCRRGAADPQAQRKDGHPAETSGTLRVDATVADAVRLGADAVGYTLYVGTPGAGADFAQYWQVRRRRRAAGNAADRVGLPARPAIEAKGGKDSFYAVDYAARTSSELGADMVKVNFPQPEKQAGVPEAYGAEFPPQQAIDAVVRSANRTLLLVSGGEQAGDEAMLEKARAVDGGRAPPG